MYQYINYSSLIFKRIFLVSFILFNISLNAHAGFRDKIKKRIAATKPIEYQTTKDEYQGTQKASITQALKKFLSQSGADTKSLDPDREPLL